MGKHDEKRSKKKTKKKTWGDRTSRTARTREACAAAHRDETCFSLCVCVCIGEE